MNHFATSIRHFINTTGKSCSRKPVTILIFLFACAFPVASALAQIPNCSADVPTYNIDFTGNPAGTFTTPSISRRGNCCGTSSPDRCIHFAITLDTAVVAVSFQITSGAIPPGAIFYQVDCGPQTPVGNYLCVSGTGVRHLTFCKPGNNVNTYTVTAIPRPLLSPADTVRVGCSKNLTALGFSAPSVTWSSIFPGAPGAYNSYLSCTTGCTNPLFTPQAGSPSYIDYEICGSPIATGCGLSLSYCDTIRVYVYPALTVSINPSPASFCPTSSGVTLSASVAGGFGAYSYVWKKSGTTVGVSSTYFATTAGTYTVDVKDGLTACPTITASILVTIANISLSTSSTNVSCNGGSDGTATVTASGGTLPYTYLWSPNVGTTATVNGLAAQTYSVTVTDAGGCFRDTTIVVGQPTALSAVIDSVSDVVCNGQSSGAVYVSVSGGTPPYTYHWSSGQTTQDISGVPIGFYTDTIFDSKGCIAIVSDSVTEPATIVSLPTNGTINGNDLSCYGSNDGFASVIVVGGTPPYQYSWSSNPTDTLANVTALPAGPLSVLITDANGCTLSASTIINQPDSITSAGIADSVYFGGYNVTCYGDTNAFASITVNGGTVPYSYLWSNGDTTYNLTNVAAGNYIVTITDAQGCVKIDSIELIEPDSLLNGVTSPVNSGGYNIACKGQSSGSMDLSIIGGTAPFIIAWSTGDSNTTHLTNLFAGFYSVNIIDINGCTAMDTITLTEPDTLVPLITATVVLGGSNVLCYGGTMDSATVIVTGGTAPFTFLWSPTNDSTQTIYNVSADTISVLVTDTNGCSGSDDYVISEPTPLQSSVHASLFSGGYSVSCFGASDGYAVVVSSGGTPPYSYSWSNAATTDSIFNLMAGNYTITITDTNGCVKVDSVLLTQPNLLVVTPTADVYPSGDNISCNGSADGAIDAIVTGGTGPYSYVWSTSPTDTLTTISGLTIGRYTVTVTDDNGCMAVDSVDLTEPTPLVIDSLFSPVFLGGWNVSCNGGDDGSIFSFVSGGSAPYSYSWSNGDTTQNTLNVSVFTYTDTVIDLNGCRVFESITLTEPQPIISSPGSIAPVGCFGDSTGSITITTTGGTLPYQYSIDGIVFSSSNTFAGLPAGTYVIFTADTNGCADSIVVVISEPAYALSSSLASQTNVNCFGDSTGSISVSTTGGTLPYLFSIGGPFQTDSTFSNLVDGSYTITVQDSNNCTTTVSVTISQPAAALSASISSQTNIACFNDSSGSVSISVSGGTSPYEYSIGGAFQPGNIFTGLFAGSYIVTVRDTNNCTDTVHVNIVQPLAALTIGVTGLSNVDCHGNANGSFTVSVSGGFAPYLYSLNGAPYVSDSVFSNLSGGNYNIYVDDAGGCVDSVVVVINEPAYALSSILDSQTNVNCFGDSTGSISVSTTGGTLPYLFSIGGPFQTDSTFSNLVDGSYTITVQDSNNCTTTVSVTISQPAAALSASISSQTNIACFNDSSGSVSISVSGGTSPYEYSIGGAFQPGNIFTGLFAGSYIVTVRDTNNCTDTVHVNIVQPLAALTIGVTGLSNVDCHGNANGSFTVSVSGGFAPYLYSLNGAPYVSDSVFSNLSGGTYTIYVADTGGCVDSVGVIILEPAYVLNSILDSQTNVNCFGDTTGSLTVSTTGGTLPYSFSIGGPYQPDSTFSNLADGFYTVTVRDSNNCTTTVSVTISQPAAAISASISSQTNVDCYNDSSGSVVISASGGTPPYQYSIGGSFQTSNVFSDLMAGSYIVTVRDTNNCTDLVLVNITQPSFALSASISALFDVDCYGASTGSITVSASGGTMPYLFSLNGGPFGPDSIFTNLFAGADTITVSDGNDCIAIIDTIISEPSAALSALVTAISNVDCRGNSNGSLTVTVSGGTPSYQYSINGGVTWVNNPMFSNLAGGTYFIDIRDINGCTTQTSTSITEPLDSLTVTVSSNIGVECFGNATGVLTVTASGGRLPYLFSIGSGFQSSNTFLNLTAGPYTVVVLDSNNNCIAQVLTSISQPTSPIVAGAGQPANVCGSSTNMTATLNSGLNGIWSLTGVGSGIFADPTNPTTTVTGLSLGSNTFQWHVSSGNCKDSALVTIIQDAAVMADGGDDADTCENQSTSFSLRGIQPSTGSGLWTVVPTSAGTVLDPTSYNSIYTPSVAPSTNVLVWTVVNGACIDRDTLILNYYKGGECFTELDLPSAFSPNQDSRNDAYVIHGIELYPENVFVVFNRWGDEVYSKENYRNLGTDDADWKGQNKSGADLPEGTYFVILKVLNADIVRTTYVDIRK